MGMRIRKKWDLLSETGVALAILSVAFLLGGGLGCLLAGMSSGTGAEELGAYLTDYLLLAGEEGAPRSLWPLLWNQLKYLLAVLLFSWTALGVAGLPILFGVRGFFFSFSAACFCRIFGERGLFPAFALFGLSALLWTPALFMAGVPGFLSARQLLRRTAGDSRGGIPLYWFWLCVCLALAAGLLEYWVVPVLLRAAARIVL